MVLLPRLKQQEGSGGWCLNLSHLQTSRLPFRGLRSPSGVAFLSQITLVNLRAFWKESRGCLVVLLLHMLGAALWAILTPPDCRCPGTTGWWPSWGVSALPAALSETQPIKWGTSENPAELANPWSSSFREGWRATPFIARPCTVWALQLRPSSMGKDESTLSLT